MKESPGGGLEVLQLAQTEQAKRQNPERHEPWIATKTAVAKRFLQICPFFLITERGILGTFLVRSDTCVKDSIDGGVNRDVGFYPCLKCAACKNFRKRCFEFRSCTYKIKHLVSCAFTNVIYLVCGLNNKVSKTNRQIRTRIIEHISAIRRKDSKSPVARHFVEMFQNLKAFEKLTDL